MARTLEQIKTEITDAWMLNETLQKAYGWDDGAQFSTFYSKVSLENLICYIVAAAIWTHEKLFDVHTTEVENYIAQMKPHTLRWYVNKVKEFRMGESLIEGTDQYAAGGNANEIEQKKVVKFAAATESAATIYIKVATEVGGKKQPISDSELDGLRAYIAEVKDAGVRVDVINHIPNVLRVNMTVFYNPMVLDDKGKNLASGKEPVMETIKQFVENLSFDGELRTDRFVDAIQQTEGVVIIELNGMSDSFDRMEYTTVSGYVRPYAGYYDFDKSTITINYVAYENS